MNWLSFSKSEKKGRNIRVMMVCVFLATAFWILNTLSNTHTATINYPVSIGYDDASYVAVENLPKKIQLRVSGSGWNILKYSFQKNKQPLRYQINSPRQLEYLLSSSFHTLALEKIKDLTLTEVVVDTFYIHFDTRIRKKVKVKVDQDKIKLKEDYKIVSDIEIKPEYVIFEGPTAKINLLKDEIYLSISDEEIDGDYNKKVKIKDQPDSLLKTKPQVVEVSFMVEKYSTQTQEVDIKVIHKKNRYLLTDQKAEIVYMCKESDKDEISPESFTVTADFNHIDLKDTTLILQLDHSSDKAEEVRIVNPKIKVNVR